MNVISFLCCLRILFKLFVCDMMRRYTISFTKIRLWQFIPYKDDLMRVSDYIASNSEMDFMRTNTQFKNTLNNYNKPDILTKRLVFLHVDWDKSALLLTKRLHIVNEIIGYSYTRTQMNCVLLCGAHETYIYIYLYIYIYIYIYKYIYIYVSCAPQSNTQFIWVLVYE